MSDHQSLIERLPGPDVYEKIAASHAKLARGQVWCHSCGWTRHVDSADALRSGWPKCCGSTMSIDSPEERRSLSQEEGR